MALYKKWIEHWSTEPNITTLKVQNLILQLREFETKSCNFRSEEPIQILQLHQYRIKSCNSGSTKRILQLREGQNKILQLQKCWTNSNLATLGESTESNLATPEMQNHILQIRGNRIKSCNWRSTERILQLWRFRIKILQILKYRSKTCNSGSTGMKSCNFRSTEQNLATPGEFYQNQILQLLEYRTKSCNSTSTESDLANLGVQNQIVQLGEYRTNFATTGLWNEFSNSGSTEQNLATPGVQNQIVQLQMFRTNSNLATLEVQNQILQLRKHTTKTCNSSNMEPYLTTPRVHNQILQLQKYRIKSRNSRNTQPNLATPKAQNKILPVQGANKVPACRIWDQGTKAMAHGLACRQIDPEEGKVIWISIRMKKPEQWTTELSPIFGSSGQMIERVDWRIGEETWFWIKIPEQWKKEYCKKELNETRIRQYSEKYRRAGRVGCIRPWNNGNDVKSKREIDPKRRTF